MRLFDPEVVKRLTEKVPSWREEHKQAGAKARSKAAKKAARTRRLAGARGHAENSKERKTGLVEPFSIHAQRRREAFAVSLSEAFGERVTASHEIRETAPADYPDEKSLAPLRIFEDYRISRSVTLAIPRFADGESNGTQLGGGEAGTQVSVRFALGVRESGDLAVAVLGSKSVRRHRDAVALCARSLRTMVDNLDRIAAAWSEAIHTRIATCRSSERSAILNEIAADADKALVRVAIEPGAGADTFVERALDALQDHAEGPLRKQLLRERTRAFQENNRYDRYPALFPQARAMNRQIVFFCGPTNSGKTHEALAMTEAAASAEILAPLRLLALEHYETLSARGVKAGMITGEEEILPVGATHIARTIETLDTRRVVDFCVIDEIQMIDDPSRGWAWTRALVGVPARTVVLTGSPEAIPAVESICELTGERLIVHELERKSALSVLPAPVPLQRLEPGDAIIAFSRRDVHVLRTMVADLGYEVACIYGALGPEVRRAEAARFAAGRAAVLIATDAIGMGLNLPIRRVLFSDLEKFDGISRRRLRYGEIRQIGGRAGRYGKAEQGFVGTLSMCKGPHRDIAMALAAKATEIDLPAPVCPDLDAVLAAAEVVKSDRLTDVLAFLRTNLVPNSFDFTMIDTSEIEMLVECVDDIPLPLDVRWTYVLSPFDRTNSFMLGHLALQHARKGKVVFSNDLLERFEDHPVYSDFGNPILFDYLEMMERSARFIDAWLWLARRYPDVYEGTQAALERRNSLATKIERFLQSTSEDLVQRARQRAERQRRKAEAKRVREENEGAVQKTTSSEGRGMSRAALKAERKRLKRRRQKQRRAEKKRREVDNARTSITETIANEIAATP